jgi:hypothetical protein
VKNVGEPCAGEPHARIDGGREETKPVGLTQPRGPGASRLPDQPPREQHLGLMGSMASERIAQFFIRSPGVAVPVDESAAGKLRRRRAGRWRRISRCSARGRVRANFSGLVHINARIRSSVVDELALRPEFSAQVRMPPTALLAPRGVWRGLPVLTAGLVPYFYGRYLTGSVASSLRD